MRFQSTLLTLLVATSVLLASGLQAATVAYRASILHFIADPQANPEQSYQYLDDGLLVVKDGRIVELGKYEDVLPKLSEKTDLIDYSGRLILPGFIDTHIHYPQTEMIAAYGAQLLEWLNTYTFPTERKYQDYDYARKQSKFFIEQLLRNGTTTALVFGTVHPESVEALFDEASTLNMRMIAGKVMMDRNAPEFLLDTADSSYEESKKLIQKWHGYKRLSYAITPRFAPTSTPEQLAAAGRLKKEFPSVYVHTHLSENKNEVSWVQSLYPKNTSYFDVYDSFGLAGDRSIFAHSIHLSDEEISSMAASNSSISFCPTSNLFLGSGLFKFFPITEKGIRVGFGTDVGAGTSFSMFQTMNEAYKVVQLQGQKLSALQSLYTATLGGAKALSLDDKVGNFAKGKEADFAVIDLEATPLTKMRNRNSKDLMEKLFALITLADDRHISATFVDGKEVYTKR